MNRGQHSKRDQAPTWAIHLFFVVIACALLWVAWVMIFA